MTDHIETTTDATALPGLLLARARELGAVVATAESCTAGLLAGAITEVAGSSAIFDRGFVTYTNRAKMEMLGVSGESLDAYGAVSEQVAREMAEGALAHSEATIAVSITGIAGPGGSEHKPEGMVCFGLARQGHPTITQTQQFGAPGRSIVRQNSVANALSMLLEGLGEAPRVHDRAP